MVFNIADSYDMISEIYDKCGVSDFSISFGESILKFFNENHPNEEFTKNLDICCGTGTLCNFFNNKGIFSRGVDISKGMIEKAKEKYPEIEFICADASTYLDNIEYDFITCTDDALNHIVDVNIFEKIIFNVYNSLRSGGYFIFDIDDYGCFIFDERYTKGFGENYKLSYLITREDKKIFSEVKYYEYDELAWEVVVEEYDYSLDFVKNLLEDIGFEVELCTKDFYGTDNEIKWKFVARKM